MPGADSVCKKRSHEVSEAKRSPRVYFQGVGKVSVEVAGMVGVLLPSTESARSGLRDF